MRTFKDLLGYEIKNGTQRSVGVLYALNASNLSPGGKGSYCQTINKSIIKRWSHAGLEKVKNIAWKISAAMD